jgi:predicted dehydrogenase
MSENRRAFLKKAVAGSVGLTVGSKILSGNAGICRNNPGAGDIIRVAIIGCNSRGESMAGTFARQKGAEVIYICDIDDIAMQKGIKAVKNVTGKEPKGVKDFRKILDDKDLDAVYIATPDHWHACGTWLALEAGKNVYVEKPCSHNPKEGELHVAFQKKYGKVVQMGNQQRSMPESIEIINEIHKGAI